MKPENWLVVLGIIQAGQLVLWADLKLDIREIRGALGIGKRRGA